MTGQGGSKASDVSMVIEDIREIARDVVGAATDHAEDSQHTFASVGVGVSDFSNVPMAREFALQHKAAHEVFRKTISGVLADLEDFRTQLLACADGHEATDDEVHSQLRRMSRRYERRTLHSERNYDRSRRQQGTALKPSAASGDRSSGSHHHTTENPTY